MNTEEYYRIKIAVALANNLHLSVEDVMRLAHCNEDDANRLMHELTLINLAEWNLVDGRLDYNILWFDED